MSTPLSALATLGRGQLSLLTRPQLRDVLTDDQLERCVHSGALERLQPNVYRIVGSPSTYLQRVLAATLCSGAVASHRTAAVLWKLLEQAAVIDVTVPYQRKPRLHNVVVHRSTDLMPHHVSFTQGIVTTNPLRTLVDVGSVVRDHEAVADMMEIALSTDLVSVLGLETLLTELARPGRRGAGMLGHLLDDRALGRDRADGLLEPRMARLLRMANLPRAVFQLEVRIGRRRFRIDFAYPDLMIAIEVDGYEKWQRRERVEETLERQNLLVRAGWRVLRFSWHHVVRRSTDVAATIGDEIRDATARLL